ncbi:predicted protein [Micromonas commoda]|uniref:C-CAP/cofactor C-like domain-containing protein n=1 Tax=Micromonas commoda (strain RCC299 / NOUM17 / CCMP2709) TaxID=296587 RepID=C1DZ23_MICCC|nr:predicted protein [Micromonas commoda]ACO61040.1 predicted protein [Micromonas commoda]|eukprot:XP_002499782.1 predicted protein [Micromonas commoda]
MDAEVSVPNDGGDQAKMEAKRVQMMDRLAAIEEARKADADARRAELDAAADPRENIRSFLAGFEERKARVEGEVNSHRSAVGTPDAKPADDLRAALDALQADVIAIERSVAEASYFLPAYDSRACTAAVDHLKKTVADATAELLPRKKFTFSKKKKEATASKPDSEKKETDDVAAQLARIGIRTTMMTTTSGTSGPKGSKEDEGPGVRNRTGETVVVDASSAVGDFELKRLVDCEVYLCNLEPLDAVRACDLRNTRVYVGPVAGSVLLHGADACEFHLCARQVRIHDATNGTSFYVRTASGPIIEHSSDVRFAPYAFGYPGIDEAMEKAGFGGADPGKWREVEDFGWIKQVASPNWRILAESERVPPPKPPSIDAT